MAEVADAVHHAHEQGSVHHDLEPASFLVEAGGRPRVLDLGRARVVDAAGEAVVELRGHGAYVWSVAFAPAGEWLASGSGDGTVRLLGDAPSRRGHPRPARLAAGADPHAPAPRAWPGEERARLRHDELLRTRAVPAPGL